jgi:cyclopropane-fatty-acyl-phospholipid synthase
MASAPSPTKTTASPEQQALSALLARADVRLDGGRPWDLRVHDPRFYRRVLAGGSLAFGESYMDGLWDCEALDECLCRVLSARLDREVRSWRMVWNVVRAKLLNLQSTQRAYNIGEHHYDRGNDLFEVMLGERMIYSAGYWRNLEGDHPGALDAAQEAKLDLVCRKLRLQAGDRVLDIGCGWGGFLEYAAAKYGVEGVGLTVSGEQARLARERCRAHPVEIRLQDYRDLHEQFDHVVSIGMFEHVGPKNYETYFDTVRRCLRPGGLFVLETLSAARTSGTTNAWMNKYIFPGGSAPSAQQLAAALEERLVIEDWHNFGADYDRTLMAWHRRFADGWPALRGRYDERFRRMWRFYLLACAGTFRARRNQNWQLVLSDGGADGGYRGVR